MACLGPAKLYCQAATHLPLGPSPHPTPPHPPLAPQHPTPILPHAPHTWQVVSCAKAGGGAPSGRLLGVAFQVQPEAPHKPFRHKRCRPGQLHGAARGCGGGTVRTGRLGLCERGRVGQVREGMSTKWPAEGTSTLPTPLHSAVYYPAPPACYCSSSHSQQPTSAAPTNLYCNNTPVP